MKIILSCIVTLYSLAGFSQAWRLKIQNAEELPAEVRDIVTPFESSSLDSTGVYSVTNAIKLRLYEKGYLLSSAIAEWKDSTGFIHIDPGKRVWWKEVRLTFPDSLILSVPQGIGLNRRAMNPAELEKYTSTFLTYLENQGYPFAQLSFTGYQISDDSVSGNIFINPGPFTTIDSIVIKGYDRFSANVLRYDLSYQKGMPYSEAYINRLPELIQRVEYLSFSRPPAVAFTKEKAILFLYVREVKSNQIDGVIGLNTEEDGKVVFTGDFQLRLLNTLKRGEEIKIRWRRPDESVSNLDIGLSLPYLFNTPFWTEGDLSIFRQDSSFVNTEAEGYLKYLIEGGNFLSAGITYRSSNVLGDDFKQNPSSNFNSFRTTAYKLGYERRAADRAIVPRKGNILRAYVLTGRRRTAQSSQEQYGWEFYDEQYFPVAGNHIVRLALSSEALFGEDLFENELFRIGGLKSLRGFNEQSIYASSYGIATLEYRYMIGEYDYLTAFSDLAYVERNSLNAFSANYFLGLGTGLNFRTNGGIFSLFLAIGRDDENPFDFRTAKIHFGYVNRF